MNKSKLLDIFRSIQEEEWKDLLDFIRSPYFNKNQQVVELCIHLRQLSRRNYPLKELKTQIVWDNLYQARPYEKKEMAYIMSKLLKLTEHFLGQQQLKQSKHHHELYVLQALAQRKLDKNYRLLLRQLKKHLNDSQKNDQEHYKLLTELAEIENQHFNQQNQRVYNPHLSDKNQALDQYFQISKLSLFCDMLNQKRVLASVYDYSWPGSPFSDELPPPENDVLEVYQTLFALLSKPSTDTQLFQAYNASLAQLAQQLSPTELIRLYYFSINYCLYEINRGKREYATALLDIYQDGLKNGNLLIAGELSPWIFKNMVKLGLGLKQFAWVQNIIENYSQKLPSVQQKDAFAFNMADLAYHQKKYEEALTYLNQVDFKDPFYKHGSKTILLKIYFEKKESEAFFALASSYRIMLLRDQNLSENANMAYANFNNLITKLYNIRNQDEKAIEQFEKKLKRAKSISDKMWLIQQLNLKRKVSN